MMGMSASTTRYGASLTLPRRGTFWRIVCFSAMFVSLIGMFCWGANEPKRKPTEFEVKAAYLYNFGKFVRWPANAPVLGNTFPICILGDDQFGVLVDSIVEGESMNGMRLTVH